MAQQENTTTTTKSLLAEQTEEKKDDEEAWPEDAPDDDEKKGDDDEKKTDEFDNKCGVSVRIAPATTAMGNVQDIVLELCGSPKKGRCPVDICAVLDVSGSMGSSAAVQEDDGSVKNDNGLSVLDLVKHSVKTVIHCLEKNDRFSIVAFNNDAQVHYNLSYMTEDGMKRAVVALEQLNYGGTTNIWEGLYVGMDSLRSKQQIGRPSVVMLLTDGAPNVIPPNGHIHELQKYVDTTNFAVQINTFGFGYSLDSNLLHSLAVHGNGTFAFIPDSNIVGTTFVNSVANVLTTISTETTLSLTAMNGAKFADKSWGAHNEQDRIGSWGRVIKVGPIMCGTTRYISVPMSIPDDIDSKEPYLECMISTAVLGGRGKSNKMSVFGTEKKVANDLLAGSLTAKVVSFGLEATQFFDKQRKEKDALELLASVKQVVEVAAEIASKSDTDDFDQMTANSRLDALNKDVQGRFNKAFQGATRFNRWGKHYLYALLRAHQLNMCTNFMDPGLQVNGGNLFRELRAKGDEVFINLPAPKPSRNVVSYNYNNAQPARQAPAVNMATYYGGAGGGCFAPYCMVTIMDMNTKQYVNKQVCDVRPGDMVKVAGDDLDVGFATVILVVELARDKGRRMIQLPGGLVITGGHPVRRNGLWCLPREQIDAQITRGCDTVFTFVLDKWHVMIVNGMECVTWGHHINDAVVRHSFFGTDKVIGALMKKSMDMRNKEGREIVEEDVDPLDNVIAIYQQ